MEKEDPPGSQHPGRRANASPAKAGDVQEVQAAGGVAASAASTLGEEHKNRGEGRGLGRSVGVSITGGGGDYVRDEEGGERLDPLGTLPLISTESPWIANAGNGEGGLDEEDDLGAYDLWDEEEDLAAVAEPVYLDQLIDRERRALNERRAINYLVTAVFNSARAPFSPLFILYHFLTFRYSAMY